MRPAVALLTLSLLAGCATNQPTAPQTGTTDNPEDTRPWCQRNQNACIALLPVLLPLALAEEVARQFPTAFLNAASNSAAYSDTVRTPNGVYDVHSFCVSGSCDTTVRRR